MGSKIGFATIMKVDGGSSLLLLLSVFASTPIINRFGRRGKMGL
jgi:hypothetical protein